MIIAYVYVYRYSFNFIDFLIMITVASTTCFFKIFTACNGERYNK